MRTILVDDELLLLSHMEKLLTEIDDIQLIGMYNNPYQALEAILRDKPDVVFLDIEMPEINGIQMAEQIQNVHPSINIVFITAYSEYAVRAFEINAVDYILKPLKRDRLMNTIQRFKKDYSTKEAPTRSPMVCCFQSLQFTDAWSQKLDVRWRTNKAKELFLFLLQYRNQLIRKDVILDILWPEAEWDKAYTLIYTTIYQIRKTLETMNLPIKILSREDSYILDLNGVKLDIDEWENGIHQSPPVTSETLSYHQQIMNLYQGEYLAETDYTWAEGERERLKNLWIIHVKKLADYFAATEQYHEAIHLYHRIQELHPYAEDSYFMLMKLYDKISERYLIELQYQKLTNMLSEQFGVVPNQDVQMWYERWMKKQDK